MKTKNNAENSIIKKVIIVLVCLVAVLIVVFGVLLWQKSKPDSKQDNAESVQTTTQYDSGGLVVPDRPEMIDITAYDTIKLKADTLEQSLRLNNPLENNCWLVITLSLEDGTELWKSEELIPGQVVRSITLNKTLPAGEYENAVLSYKHWTYDDKKEPLNGAETLVKLVVQ
ncbi:MAG: hypothetical protein IJJ61_10380 [Clostridia bacterium]|nr:hypothetical protein [Clostridia bacterium]